MEKQAYTIGERECILYTQEQPPEFLLLQPTGEHELSALDGEVEMLNQCGTKFAFLALEISDWNEELCPWEAPQAFGDTPFGAGAGKTLEYIHAVLLPWIREHWNGANLKIILGGYSLAGFFSLWSAYQTDLFYAVTACSPSVWIAGWEDYMERYSVLTKRVYLSIGSKEHKTRNPMMQTVRKKITTQYEQLQQQGIATTLEILPGNHFTDCDIRTAKGFLWCLQQ